MGPQKSLYMIAPGTTMVIVSCPAADTAGNWSRGPKGINTKHHSNFKTLFSLSGLVESKGKEMMAHNKNDSTKWHILHLKNHQTQTCHMKLILLREKNTIWGILYLLFNLLLPSPSCVVVSPPFPFVYHSHQVMRWRSHCFNAFDDNSLRCPTPLPPSSHSLAKTRSQNTLSILIASLFRTRLFFKT